jgi:hypothetical protein
VLKVLVTLIAGLFSQLLSNSDIVQIVIYNHSYLWYKLTISAIYLSFALCCVKLAVTEVDSQRNYSATLISVLCLCMLITASFNIAMIDTGMFYTLNEYKTGYGMSWKNIYLTIELLIATMVIANGISVMFNFCIYYFFLGNCANNINQSNFKGE